MRMDGALTQSQWDPMGQLTVDYEYFLTKFSMGDDIDNTPPANLHVTF